MKKIKLLTLFSTISIVGIVTAPLTSCANNNTEQKCAVVIQAGANGIVDKQSLEVKKGVTWKDIKGQVTPTANKGYHFKEWQKNGFLLLDDFVINSDMCAVAIFEIDPVEECTINFVSSEGGSIGQTEAVKVKKGTIWDDVTKPTASANDGYYFDDWYNGDKKLNRTTIIEQSMTVTGKFNAIARTDITPDIYYINDLSFLGASYVKIASPLTTKLISMFNGLAMAYTPLDALYGQGILPYDFVQNDYKAVITNKFHSDRQATCTFDFRNQTITFDSLDEFYDFDTASQIPMAYRMLGGGYEYFKDNGQSTIKVNKYVRGTPYIIDLNKYNIKIIWDENRGFIPWELLNVVLNFPLTLTIANRTVHLWQFEYNGSAMYEIPAANQSNLNEVNLKAEVRSTSNGYYSSEYMEYVYSLLGLSLDLRYGMVQRQSRANPGKTIKYLEGGALNVLKPYHDGIVSTEFDVSSDTIRKAMRENFDDFGHTLFQYLNIYSKRTIGLTHYGEESIYYSKLLGKLNDARIKKLPEITTAKTYGHYKAYPSDKGNIAYVTFDNFINTEYPKWTEEEQGKNRELPNQGRKIDEDTIRLTMYVNEQIRADKDNIKYLVLDLSENGGGTAYTEQFLASWICGGVTEKIYNPKTGAYIDYTCYADINGDGKYDDGDKLSKDIQLFIITSSLSFSSGNILSCNVKDNRPETVFIGHNSGGGPCVIDSQIALGANAFYQASSNTHLIRLDSTETNPITIDDGIGTPDWQMDEWNNPEDFYDRDKINEKIWAQ